MVKHHGFRTVNTLGYFGVWVGEDREEGGMLGLGLCSGVRRGEVRMWRMCKGGMYVGIIDV